MMLKRSQWLVCAALLAFGALGCVGEQGPPGSPGARGDDGQDGRDGVDGVDGQDGQDGQDGIDGQDGADGDGSSVASPVATGRLAFNDRTAGGLRFLDLETGVVISTFAEILPAALLYATESGRIITAVQNRPVDANALDRVDFIDSGLVMSGSQKTAQLPKLLTGASLVGSSFSTAAVNPIHFVAHSGYVTLHWDGIYNADPAQHIKARNFVIPELELLEASPNWTLDVPLEAHHGVSVVSMVNNLGHLILSSPSKDRTISTLPGGFTIHTLDGTKIQEINDWDDVEKSCLGMHGEASVGPYMAFGCDGPLDGGVFVIYPSPSGSADPYTSRKIKYPGYNGSAAGTTADPRSVYRSGTLQSHHGSAYLIANYGNSAETYRWLIRIDPTKDALEQTDTLSLGSALCSFNFDQSSPTRAAALTRDGRIHVANVADWSSYKTLKLLPDGGTSCPGTFVVGQGYAYVVPNGTGLIHEVDLTSLEVTRIFSVGGDPSSLALASWPSH